MTTSQNLERESSHNPAAPALMHSVPRELLDLIYIYLDLDAVIALRLLRRRFYFGGLPVSHPKPGLPARICNAFSKRR